MCCIVESYNTVSTYFLNLQRYGHCTKNDVSIKDLFGKCDQNPQFPADLVTFTEEFLMENFIFCAAVVLAEILLIYLLFQFRSKLYIFFYLGFLSQTLRIYRTAGDYLYSSLPPPPAQ